MKLINKILNKFNDKFDNYFEIINFNFPVLFCVEMNGNVKIGFINLYRPTRGEISFILAESNYTEIINTINESESVRKLFNSEIISYKYNKGHLDCVMVDSDDVDNYLPSNELVVQEVFNAINVQELLRTLEKQNENCPYFVLNGFIIGTDVLVQKAFTPSVEKLEETINLYLNYNNTKMNKLENENIYAMSFLPNVKKFMFHELYSPKINKDYLEYNYKSQNILQYSEENDTKIAV